MFSNYRTGCIVFLLAGASLTAGPYESARDKIQLIVNDRAQRGAVYSFTSQELTAYMREELPAAAPEGIRNPRVQFQQGGATVTALVDFLKLERQFGRSSGWLMRKVLEGEHLVTVAVRLAASQGQCRADIVKAQLDGIPLPASALELLLQHVVLPHMPGVKIGEPFALKHNIERIDITPAAARVGIRR